MRIAGLAPTAQGLSTLRPFSRPFLPSRLPAF